MKQEKAKAGGGRTPLAAWFVVMTIVAGPFAVAAELFSAGFDPAWPTLFGSAFTLAFFGAIFGGFAVPRARGILFGGVIGSFVGAFMGLIVQTPVAQLEAITHVVMVWSLLMPAAALVGRWRK